MASLRALREEVQGCRACELYKGTTQAVFGEGLAKSEVMFVGEQPGDREDREGKPFVGPAGRIFDQALVEAGIDRSLVYVTNTVKHFHYTERGKRRIHQRPRAEHIKACRPWLDAELEALNAAIGSQSVATVEATSAEIAEIEAAAELTDEEALKEALLAGANPNRVAEYGEES